MVMVKKHGTKNKIILALVIVIVIFMSALTGYLMFNRQPNEVKHVATPEEKVSEILNSDSISDKSAQDQLTKLAQDESDTSKKALYLLGLSTSYENSGNYAAAVDSAKQAEVSNESALSAAAIADSYAGNGNFQEAAKYYELAAQRSEKSASRTERSPYNDYLNLKEDMESKIK